VSTRGIRREGRRGVVEEASTKKGKFRDKGGRTPEKEKESALD